jgi:hypothetical protein
MLTSGFAYIWYHSLCRVTETFADADFLADATKQGYMVYSVSGPQMKKLVDDLVTTPPAVVKELARLIDPKGRR